MKEHELKSQYTLAELIQGLSSDLDVQIKGDPTSIITGIGTIQDTKPQQITFLVNPLYKKYLPTTKAAAVILSPKDAADLNGLPINLVITRNPYFTYAKIAAFFDPKSIPCAGLHSSVVLGKNCQIDPTASIAAHTVIGNNVRIAAGVIIGPNCTIGENSIIEENSYLDAHVTLYNRILIGKRVQIASGTVIGSDGFGMAKHQGKWSKIPQIGRVILQDDVEIGANCAIDRGAIEDTVIESGVKLDNLIQVGHNVHIGENTAIAGCTGISGSAVIGKNCLIGGGVCIAGHISIADNVVITGATMVTKTIREAGVYSSGIGGLTTNNEWRKNSARVNRLDVLMQRVKALESTLEELQREK